MEKFKIEKPKNVNQRITVRVNVDMFEKINSLAKENNVSVNSLIISCIEFAFKNME